MLALLYLVAADAAATADIKRDLATVFVASKDWTRAFATLAEALQIEVERDNQPGIALTHESMGGAKAARTWWQQSEESCDASLKIFRTLGDQESIARVSAALAQMQERRRGRTGNGSQTLSLH